MLTTLGILFGVAAVISTVGIGQASSDSVTARISSLGTNLLTISPGSTVAGGVFGGGGSANTLTMADVAGLLDPQNAPDIEAVAPVVQGRESLVSGSSNWSTTVSGSTPDWLTANSRTIGTGSFFTTKRSASGSGWVLSRQTAEVDYVSGATQSSSFHGRARDQTALVPPPLEIGHTPPRRGNGRT